MKDGIADYFSENMRTPICERYQSDLVFNIHIAHTNVRFRSIARRVVHMRGYRIAQTDAL